MGQHKKMEPMWDMKMHTDRIPPVFLLLVEGIARDYNTSVEAVIIAVLTAFSCFMKQAKIFPQGEPSVLWGLIVEPASTAKATTVIARAIDFVDRRLRKSSSSHFDSRTYTGLLAGMRKCSRQRMLLAGEYQLLSSRGAKYGGIGGLLRAAYGDEQFHRLLARGRVSVERTGLPMLGNFELAKGRKFLENPDHACGLSGRILVCAVDPPPLPSAGKTLSGSELLDRRDLATAVEPEDLSPMGISKEELKDVLGQDADQDDCIHDWDPEDLLREALLRCAEHFKDLSDSEMELKMTLLALGRFRVYEECCQARVHSCLWPDLNEPEAGIVGKGPEQAARVAGILAVAVQCIKAACLDAIETEVCKDVDADCISAAVQIVEFCKETHLGVYRGVRPAQDREAARVRTILTRALDKMMEKQQAVFDRMTLGNLWRRLRCHGAVEMTCRDLAKRIAELGLFQLHEYDDGASGAGRKSGPGWKLTAWPPETVRSATAVEQVQFSERLAAHLKVPQWAREQGMHDWLEVYCALEGTETNASPGDVDGGHGNQHVQLTPKTFQEGLGSLSSRGQGTSSLNGEEQAHVQLTKRKSEVVVSEDWQRLPNDGSNEGVHKKQRKQGQYADPELN